MTFLAIYVREAHPSDGWRMASNDRAGISFTQPINDDERVAVATQCCSTLEISMPLLVDAMDDRVGHAYSGMPDRLYVIDREGRVAYKAGRGPFGFKPGEMEQSLVMLLVDQDTTAPAPKERLAVPSNEEAWRHLPSAETGQGAPLPMWARALAPSLPRTTAAMLELDCLHRVKNPLHPVVRAKARLIAAQANRCPYSEAQASAELRRAAQDEAKRMQRLIHLTPEETATEAKNLEAITESDRAVVNFATKLTLAASTVTDAEVEALTRQLGHAELLRTGCLSWSNREALEKRLGEHQLVALVLLLAYANFQDRLLLSLGIANEPDGPLPPLEARFARGPNPAARVEAPPRIPPANAAQSPRQRIADSDWLSFDFDGLQERLQNQRGRDPRIRVPSWEEVSKKLPQGASSGRPLRIRWSLVCLGYQPELAAAWSACTRAFAQEARQDRVFEETLFWVVTRSAECFY